MATVLFLIRITVIDNGEVLRKTIYCIGFLNNWNKRYRKKVQEVSILTSRDMGRGQTLPLFSK